MKSSLSNGADCERRKHCSGLLSGQQRNCQAVCPRNRHRLGQWNLRSNNRNIIAISHIGLAEVAAALAAKQRAGMLSAQDYEQTMADFISDAHRQYTAVIVDALLVDMAVDLTRRQKLRGCDAIQLASALTINTSLTSEQLLPLIFVAADSDLLAAASAEGLIVENPNAQV